MKEFSMKLRDEIVARLVAEFDPVQILLFGSHAWGIPGDDSDVDLFVLLPETKSDERLSQQTFRAHRAQRGLRFQKDILIQTAEEFERYANAPASMENRIRNEGLVLYERGNSSTGQVVVHESRA